jgi:hypothetical protein
MHVPLWKCTMVGNKDEWRNDSYSYQTFLCTEERITSVDKANKEDNIHLYRTLDSSEGKIKSETHMRECGFGYEPSQRKRKARPHNALPMACGRYLYMMNKHLRLLSEKQANRPHSLSIQSSHVLPTNSRFTNNR